MANPTNEPEALPPDPPDKRIKNRSDFPPLNTNASARGGGFTAVRPSAKFIKYLEIDFVGTDRRQVNPFKVFDDIIDITGEKPRELSGSSRTKLTLQTRSAEQTEKSLKTTSLAGKTCQIRPHPYFNSSKGLIRLKQCELTDMEDFRNHLSDQYDVEAVERANFIKTRNEETAYIITFSEEILPYSIYIPGEVADTVVAPFGSRPMICRNCYEYGHTAKHCKKSESRCRRCAAVGHREDDCSADAAKCHHCDDNHVTGFHSCPKQKEQQQVLDIVRKEKVTHQRARQKLNEKPITRTITGPSAPPFPTLFDVKLPTGTKRKINPWLVQKCIQQHTGKTPRNCRGKAGEEDTFVVEVGSADESRLMSTLIKIGQHEVVVQVNRTYDIRKGLIYVQGYDLLDFEGYEKGLKKHYNLTRVEHAHWIKTRNNLSQAIIVSFQGELPSYLDIPGESARTPVQEYKQLPNLCKKCLDYGHSQRVCRESTQKCVNCSSEEHTYPPCELEPICCHCTQLHRTGDKNCQRYKVEQEVLNIQARSRVSRNQAYVIYNREHPSATTTNYAAAAASATAVKKLPIPPKPPASSRPGPSREGVPQGKPVPVAPTPEPPPLQANRFENLVDLADTGEDEKNVTKLKEKFENQVPKRKLNSSAEKENDRKKYKVHENGEFKNLPRSVSRHYRNRDDTTEEKNDSTARRSRSRSRHSRDSRRRDRSINHSKYPKSSTDRATQSRSSLNEAGHRSGGVKSDSHNTQPKK